MSNAAKDIKAACAYLDAEIENFLAKADILPLESVAYWAAVDCADNLRITQCNIGMRTWRFARISDPR